MGRVQMIMGEPDDCVSIFCEDTMGIALNTYNN